MAEEEDVFQPKPKLELILLGLFTILYGISTIRLAVITPIWLDEWYTVCVSTMPTLRDLMGMLWDGPDAQPPLFYLITRSIISIFGESHLTLRLPAIVGYWVFCLSLYLFVRIARGGIVAASVALVFPCVIHSVYYAREARPYGMVLGCCGIALVCWRLRKTALYRTYGTVGFILSLSLLVCLHYFAIFSVFIFLATDIILLRYEIYKLGNILEFIKAACKKALVYLFPLFCFCLHFPLLWHKSKMPFWKVGLDIEELWVAYSEPFVHVRFLVLLTLIFLLRLIYKDKTTKLADDLRIYLISLLFLTLPLLLFILALMLGKTFFLYKYVITYIIGVAIILANLVWRMSANSRLAAGTLAILMLFLMNPRHSFSSWRCLEMGISKDIRESNIISEVKSEELVFITDQSYLPMYYYYRNNNFKYLYLLSAYTHSFPDMRLEPLKETIPVVQRNSRSPKFFYTDDLMRINTPRYILISKWSLKVSKAEFPSLNLDYIPVRSNEKFVLYKRKT